MIKDIFNKKLDKIIDYMFVFYLIILFCFDSNEFGVHLVQITMYSMMFLLLVKIYRNKRLIYNRSIIFMAIFILFCALTSFFALDSSLAISKSVNIFVKMFFAFLLYNNYYDGRKQRFLINTFIGASVILVLYLIKCYGIMDFFLDIFKGNRIYAGVPNNELLLGFPNINTISIISTFALIFCLYYLFQKKWIYILPAIILLLAIIGGASKSALLVIFIVLIYLMYTNKIVSNIKNKKRFYIIISVLVIVIILGIIFLPIGERIKKTVSTVFGNGNDVSTSERIILYKGGFNTFIDYPIIGIGLNNSGIIVNDLIGSPTYFHSDLIELLACTGIIGFALYVYAHYLIWKDCKKNSLQKITKLVLICFILLFSIACNYAMKYRYILLLIAYTGVCEKSIIIPDKVLLVIGKIFNWRTYVFFFKKIGLLNFLSDEKYLKLVYYATMNKKLNLDNPQTFNEKLQWLKLYDRKDIYTKMVDKCEAKEYVKNIIGEKYIIETYGVYQSFDDIDYSKLPNQFVIKTTHDSGGIVIVRDKDDYLKNGIDKAKEKINKSLNTNYYSIGREWPYKNVKPKIIVEKYMEDKDSKSMRDYKFFCFNGVPKIMYISEGLENHKTASMSFYDMDFKLTTCKRKDYAKLKYTPKTPKNFDKMKELSAILSKGIPHVRVDWYDINGKLYFGELTFSTCGGLVPFEDEKWDYKLGKWINISKVK